MNNRVRKPTIAQAHRADKITIADRESGKDCIKCGRRHLIRDLTLGGVKRETYTEIGLFCRDGC